MFAPLKLIFERVVAAGNLEVIDCDGRHHQFGDHSGVPVVVRLTDKNFEWRLAFNPQLAVGEGYMRGDLVMVQGTIYDFLEIMLGNAEHQSAPRWMSAFDSVRRLKKRIQQYNPAPRARTNVAHHYDIDGTIYDLFLDNDRQYSCAYFDASDELETAQLAKKRHIAAKLALKKGQRVLDIGSGWGGLGLYLASLADIDVTGITLSAEQLRVARARAAASAVSSRVHFELQDYRSFSGTFDRIVSIGMFEHVGVNHYKTYFARIAERLTSDGVALVHSIGRFDTPCATNPFIAKYIFPGGYIPALSEVLPAIERSGLITCDIEILRLHYAKTLRHWRSRFEANRDKAVALMGEEFFRMWEFYLAASETAFRFQNLMVFQIQLAKHQQVLPLTRNYILDEERRLTDIERMAARQNRAA